MFTSADLIEALRKRARRSLRPDAPPGEFPTGWQSWLDAMTARLGAVTGAAADAFVALFLEREPKLPPPRVGALTRWQAFATLWRQQWQAPAPEERRIRLLAMSITVAIHLVLLVLLVWIAFVRFTGAPPQPPGEEVVQVEFIGRGTPEGGGAPPGPQAKPTPRPATAPSRAGARAASAAPPIAAPPTPTAPAPAEQPTPPAAAIPAPSAPSQPLQVSNVPEPTGTFVLPPPSVRTPEVPQLEAPTLQAERRDVEMIERTATPVVATAPTQPASAPLRAPALQVEVAPALPQVQARTAEVPVLRAPTLQAPTREVPLREEAPQAETSPAKAASPARTPTNAPAVATAPASSTAAASSPAASTPAAAAPAPAPGTRSGTTPGAKATAGTGPATAKPGGWPSALPNDEWGNAARNRPGATAGTPGAESGRPGVPPGTAGAQPSSVTEHVDLDRAGTWLRRPPVGYTPTRFDKFWTPSETLLEEWVRKNIRSVSIPIPGTGKSVHCVISILQLGGGCGIDDPNMQDQEADARKPPDVPFKRELQENQDALRKPSTPP